MHLDEYELFNVCMFTDVARVCLSLHVHAADEGKE
jgi:hypothetical protein